MTTILARRSDSYLLIDDSVDPDDISFDDMGRVFDRNERVIHPEMPVHSILARGYWEPYEKSQEWLEEELELTEQK